MRIILEPTINYDTPEVREYLRCVEAIINRPEYVDQRQEMLHDLLIYGAYVTPGKELDY